MSKIETLVPIEKPEIGRTPEDICLRCSEVVKQGITRRN